ncbi:hypothetical protein U5922_010715 [Aquicoccus sp. G2-2]|uniref:hypothetical protein n=1 Tax=Aquicoccus sp. G2-2 TaxID=3092120 RepID=UPI002ADF825B|nr:hypothetical protein [Aquicoccus sp. G2-2]MEA1113915.1 hypothetical protein [Aquicoccus sp. G2-2]
MGYGKTTIAAGLEALLCLVIVCALVVLPPSSAHATSGMHDAHHAVSAMGDHATARHAHGADATHHMQDAGGALAPDAEQDQASAPCCSDICVSVVLSDTTTVEPVPVARSGYLITLVDSASADLAGFLRPPLHLS